MRHRSPRPILDLWRRRPPAAKPIGRGVFVAAAVAAFATASGFIPTADDEPSSSEPKESSVQAVPLPSKSLPTTRYEEPSPSRSAHRSASATPSPSMPIQSPARAEEPSPTDAVTRRVTSRTGQVTSPASSPTKSVLDTVAPQTSVVTISTTGSTWTVAVAGVGAVSFECSLDGAAYTPCGSTTTYRDLDPGPHTVTARATDKAGNTDATPDEATTKVNAADLPN